MNVFDTEVSSEKKTHRRAGTNTDVQVIPLGKSWAIKHLVVCLGRVTSSSLDDISFESVPRFK